MSLSEHQHFDRIFIQFSAILQNRFDKLQLNTFPYHRIPPTVLWHYATTSLQFAKFNVINKF